MSFFLSFAYTGTTKRRRWQQQQQACAGVRRADKQCRTKFIPPSRRVKKDVWSGAKQLILSLWLEASSADTDFPWQVHFKRGWNAAQPSPARPIAGMMDRQTLCFSHQTAPLGVAGQRAGGEGRGRHFFLFFLLHFLGGRTKAVRCSTCATPAGAQRWGGGKERANVNVYVLLCFFYDSFSTFWFLAFQLSVKRTHKYGWENKKQVCCRSGVFRFLLREKLLM